MGTRCLLKPECWPLRSASGRQAPPAGPELPEATPGRGWPSVTELQWPTHQDFAQTVPNAPSSQSPGPAPFALRPAASLTAGSLGAGPAVVGVVTNAVITTQQGSSEGQPGSPRSQPRRRGLPRVTFLLRSITSQRTILRPAERPTPCRPETGCGLCLEALAPQRRGWGPPGPVLLQTAPPLPEAAR